MVHRKTPSDKDQKVWVKTICKQVALQTAWQVIRLYVKGQKETGCQTPLGDMPHNLRGV